MNSGISAEAVLDFWFADSARNPDLIPARKPLWFGSDRGADARIRDLFLDAWSKAASGGLEHWARSPRGRLALIILLDQFSRNIFRGSARAFAQDEQALSLCLTGIEAGMQEELAPIERVFFLMPLQHDECLAMQELSVLHFEALAATVPEALKEEFGSFAEYARLHRDIVARFGRFPHRNAILGRRNTPEEQTYLAEGGPRFGQNSSREDPDKGEQ